LSRKSTGHLVSAVSVSATKEDLIYANHCRVGSMLSSGTEVRDVVWHSPQSTVSSTASGPAGKRDDLLLSSFVAWKSFRASDWSPEVAQIAPRANSGCGESALVTLPGLSRDHPVSPPRTSYSSIIMCQGWDADSTGSISDSKSPSGLSMKQQCSNSSTRPHKQREGLSRLGAL
jgi:hypothetical protein